MAAETDDSLPASKRLARRAGSDVASHWIIGLLVVSVGVLGLRHDQWLTVVLTSRIYLHTLFGVLLSGLVIARFHFWLNHSPPAQTADVRRFSRQLSRMVYWVLYLVIGIKQVIAIVNCICFGGTLEFGLLQDSDHAAQDLPMYQPTTDFKAVLVCGLVALGVIRVLALRSWLRLVEEAALARPTLPHPTQSSYERDSV